MARWEKVLKPTVYLDLLKQCEEENTTLDLATDNGYNVYRGADLDQFAENYMYTH